MWHLAFPNQDLISISPALVPLAALIQPTTYSPSITTTTVISATPPRQYLSSRPRQRPSGILDSVPNPGGYTGLVILEIGLISIIAPLNLRIMYLKGSQKFDKLFYSLLQKRIMISLKIDYKNWIVKRGSFWNNKYIV